VVAVDVACAVTPNANCCEQDVFFFFQKSEIQTTTTITTTTTATTTTTTTTKRLRIKTDLPSLSRNCGAAE
jgi:hypothetical protein